MRDLSAFKVVVTVLILAPLASRADVVTVWSRSALGSGLDGHYIDDAVNNRNLGGTNLRLGRSGSGSSTYRGTSYGYKNISVDPERRYRIELTGLRNEWGGVDAGLWYATAYDGGSKLAQTEGRNAKTWNTRSDDFTTGASTTQIQFRFNSFLDFNSSSVSRWHEMKDARLYKIVNAPQLAIAEPSVRVNTDAPGGTTATIALTTQNTNSWLDRPNAWSLDWGDGASATNPTLNASQTHEYTISSGDSATWAATFQGSNEAGSGSDTATIELLSQPDVALSVNELSVLDGGTVEVDVLNDPVLNLSLLDSLGFIEATSFFIPDRLDSSGVDLTLATMLFDESDIGQVFPLTVGISNMGLGINADYLSVNLSIVPEPSTAVLLGIAALFALRRRREVISGQ